MFRKRQIKEIENEEDVMKTGKACSPSFYSIPCCAMRIERKEKPNNSSFRGLGLSDGERD